jgi:nucleoid-associated protein YejK
MELSEDLFYHHSVSILNFLSLLDGDEGEQYRWQVALKAMDLFLDDFGYTLEQKRDLVKILYKGFSDEFKVGPAEQKKISERFSSNKDLVQLVMNEGWEADENLNRESASLRQNRRITGR